MSKFSFKLKFAVVLTAISALLAMGYFLTSQQNQNPTKKDDSLPITSKTEASDLREVLNASIAELGKTGWTQIKTSTKEVTVFDPSAKYDYQIASYIPGKYKGEVLGSVMIAPFDLLWKLEERFSDYKVYKTADGFGVGWINTKENGTAVTEYKVENGLLVSEVIRDHIGKNNEINSSTTYFYGISEEGSQALIFANENLPTGGHD